jgi:ABC-2 type transport system permease protein
MRSFTVLLARELRAFFYSPLAYVVWFFFLLLAGTGFWFTASAMNDRPFPLSLLQLFFQFTLWFGFVLIFPMLTMRSFAEEFKMGTIEPLMTAPVSDWNVVLSKYLAALIFYIVLWAPTALYFSVYRNISGAPIVETSATYWSAYLLVFLFGAAYLAIGILTSALSSSQMVAAVASFAIISALFYFGLLSSLVPNATPFVRDFLAYFSAPEHMNDFLRGIIDTRPIVYYLSLAVLMLALTHRVVQHRRWRG